MKSRETVVEYFQFREFPRRRNVTRKQWGGGKLEPNTVLRWPGIGKLEQVELLFSDKFGFVLKIFENLSV